MNEENESNETESQYNHEFDRVEMVSSRRDDIVVEVEIDGDEYECPIPTGDYADYGTINVVYAHEYRLIAQIDCGNGAVRDAECSADGIEDVGYTYVPCDSVDEIGAEIVYDTR